jgi:hypothetical protein
MTTITPKDICSRAIVRFGDGSTDSRWMFYNWLAGINFSLRHRGPCSRYIDRLNTELFDIPYDEFPTFAKDALEGLEGAQP